MNDERRPVSRRPTPSNTFAEDSTFAPQTSVQVALVALGALSQRELEDVIHIGVIRLARTAVETELDAWRRAA